MHPGEGDDISLHGRQHYLVKVLQILLLTKALATQCVKQPNAAHGAPGVPDVAAGSVVRAVVHLRHELWAGSVGRRALAGVDALLDEARALCVRDAVGHGNQVCI